MMPQQRSQSFSYVKSLNLISKDSISSLSEFLNHQTAENSMTINDELSLFGEKEEMVIELSKKQRKMSNYSDDGIGYSSRENILNWAEKVLTSINLSSIEKESIFHRFSTAFDFVMEKLFLVHQCIYQEKELKKLIVTIFLVTYKLEGFSIGKITIKSLIEAFLKSLKMNPEELSEEILQTELKILQIIDYNPQILDNNIHQLSFILWDLIKNKFSVDWAIAQSVENNLLEMNKLIQFSDKVLFETLPLDKAAVSLFSAFKDIRNEYETEGSIAFCDEIDELIKKTYDYLKHELKVVKMKGTLLKENSEFFAVQFKLKM